MKFENRFAITKRPITPGNVNSCGRTPNPFSLAAGAGKTFRLFYFLLK
jgi:hypothetical protein